MAYDIKVQIFLSVVDKKIGKTVLWDDTNTTSTVNREGLYAFKSGLSHHLWELASQIDEMGGGNAI